MKSNYSFLPLFEPIIDIIDFRKYNHLSDRMRIIINVGQMVFSVFSST